MIIKVRYSIRFCMPGCLVLFSQFAALPGTSAASGLSGELTVSISQRNDNLNWNIAGNTVNVLSELKWENMSATQLRAAGEIHLNNDRRVRARLGYGVINSGNNQDSDYNGKTAAPRNFRVPTVKPAAMCWMPA